MMERLDRPLRTELARLAPADGDLLEVVRAWPAAVGEALARNAWPARLRRDGTLVVHTASATWAFELGRMAAEVLDRLRSEAGAAAPAMLRFVPGPLPEPERSPAAARGGAQPEVAPEDTERARELASSVGDEELRRLVARAAAASLAKARHEAGSSRGF